MRWIRHRDAPIALIQRRKPEMLSERSGDHAAHRQPILSFHRLRILGFVLPVIFAVVIGVFTNLVLEPWLPGNLAHIAATAIVAVAALVFTAWIFAILGRMQERLQEIARLEERQRIAMRLHDDVIQVVYSVQLILVASLDGSESPKLELQRAVNQAIDNLDELVIQVRRHILEENLPVQADTINLT